jgi:hypothetical protein
VSASPTALVDGTFDRWASEAGEVCARPVDPWRVGDWLVRCPRNRGKYVPAIEAGLAEGALRAWRWVAANVAPEDRVAALSFRHHYEVAKLPRPDQRRLLALAAERHLSAQTLHAVVAQEVA